MSTLVLMSPNFRKMMERETDSVQAMGDENYPSAYEEAHTFLSGSNQPAEIHAVFGTGNNVGVAVDHLSKNGIEALCEYTGPGMSFNLMFVDSGAFSEVGFGPEGPFIKKPITDQEWEKRLAKYDLLAERLGRQVYLVAPDCVAHQDETLARLTKYAGRVQGWMGAKANVIVPVQKGTLPMDLFASQACTILGVESDEVIWGIPMKKDATTLAELGTFVESMQPARIHLLGLGPQSKLYRKACKVVRDACETTEVFCDSVRITAMVGLTNGPNGGPREITRALQVAKLWGLQDAQAKHAATQMVFTAENRKALDKANAEGWFDPELFSAPGVALED